MKSAWPLTQASRLIFLLMILVPGCTSAPSGPRLTIDGAQCSIDIEDRIPAKVTFTLDVKNQVEETRHGIVIVTLAQGKTLDDLQAIRTIPPLPEWATRVGFFSTSADGPSTYDSDIAANGNYHGEPVFILCTTHPSVLAVAGPIEVTP
ncbi:MAG TPA: hypothetical protein VLD63_14265 [Anaerolineales bacterium]|nr:hypothetical protein [Anaerolineales bacterium]